MELNLTKPIVFIDLETTGLNITTDRIIEICMIRIMPDSKTDKVTQRINPTIPISKEAFQTHGISDDDVKNQPVFADVAHSYLQFIGHADMAGYNAIKFDIPMLVEEFLRAGVDFDLRNRRFVDIQNIFHKMEPRNLAAAYRFYCNKELLNAHSAEADTFATYEILKAQLERYKETPFEDKEGNVTYPVKNDIASLSAFSYHTRNVDLVGHIVFNEKDEEVFNFGKYKGKNVEKVFLQEPQYYDWMMKGQFPFSTKKVITSIYLRGFNKSSVNLK
jgi:DNA polymerase III subunit epsilon